jgi:uncharacterized membrane protein HdeD (DUF308 family)
MFLISFFTSFDPSPSLAKEKLIEFVIGTLLSIGSAINIASALGWKKESTTWRLELIGWPMLAGAWGLYAAFVIVHGPWEFLTVIGLSSCFASIYRFIEVFHSARQTRRNVDLYRSQFLGD